MDTKNNPQGVVIASDFTALRAGVGIGGCQTGIAVRTPELVRLLLAEIAFTLEMWLVMHQDLKATRRVRLLFDFLREALGEYCAGIGNGQLDLAGR